MTKLGIAGDHGGFLLKEEVKTALESGGFAVVDFGAYTLQQDDDYPDFVIPLAKAVAAGEVERGVALCGSGVGACIVANKIPGVRAALVHETFSARQGVEDDNMNIICLGGRVIGISAALDLIKAFVDAQFSGADRHRRRLRKMEELELGR